ncbi:hypothetical protein Q765_11275 [Flavobacterium rivuli WB 3.3-2 = DSM 21788]|uniref:Uncharacterized protein n=1 Tax=Flavobacterium rivuli WB 3.3-2 = DSM 21788 TaxID=1121895 RepID=A0A0A2M1D2_9FLAO|nr:hypothetical protein [Flavobacterium rivuli]KGO86452.1 hypothetical protein Q765_11275 [Flavobacterium rivuli WB 3.3-2 = DSM 21788]
MKQRLLLLLVLVSAALFAQERKPLSGKVTSDFDTLEGIYVINKSAETSVTTTRGGYFTINARATDTLIFSAVQFEARDITVHEADFCDNLFFVPLATRNHELDELVIIDYSHINAESLGLVPRGQKQYTPAERKLATASSFKMNPLGLDPIINMFSGRTAMLQKAAEIEKKEDLMQKINYIYTEDDLVNKFKIPVDYVRGFVFYIVENKYFANAIKDKNENMARFLLTGLAEKYIKLLNE